MSQGGVTRLAGVASCCICDLPLYDLNRLITKSFPPNLPLSFVDEQVVFMMTKRFLKMTFLWYVNYRLYNSINVKHLYNFFFSTLILFMVSFLLCHWKLVPDSLILVFYGLTIGWKCIWAE